MTEGPKTDSVGRPMLDFSESMPQGPTSETPDGPQMPGAALSFSSMETPSAEDSVHDHTMADIEDGESAELVEYDPDDPGQDFGRIDVDSVDVSQLPQETGGIIQAMRAGDTDTGADRAVDYLVSCGINEDEAIDHVADQVARYKLAGDKKSITDFNIRDLLWAVHNGR